MAWGRYRGVARPGSSPQKTATFWLYVSVGWLVGGEGTVLGLGKCEPTFNSLSPRRVSVACLDQENWTVPLRPLHRTSVGVGNSRAQDLIAVEASCENGGRVWQRPDLTHA